ncbi:hypothetical protein PQX77_012800 [Marasmius sp. AFHP31]|nr:hypothetical protein PQX77_012800 [Marasmius sp. AFHP31]
MILLSNDTVVFYVDESTLLSTSDNAFDHLLPLKTGEKSQRSLSLPNVSSSELEIILLAIYNRSNQPPTPTPTPSPDIDIQTITNSIDKFVVFVPFSSSAPVRSGGLPRYRRPGYRRVESDAVTGCVGYLGGSGEEDGVEVFDEAF